MRNKWMFLGALVAVLFVAGVTQAQFAPVFQQARVTVPFVFYAGDTLMPPGAYVIQRMNDMEPQILTLSKADGNITAFLMVHLRDTNVVQKTSEVGFNKYGQNYFFADISIEGYADQQQVSPSRTEKNVAREWTGSEVVLAANVK